MRNWTFQLRRGLTGIRSESPQCSRITRSDHSFCLPGDRYQQLISDGRHKAQHAAEIIYPKRPSSIIPLSLPLSSYVGTYYHPAYQNLVIYSSKSEISSDFSTEKSILRADRTEMTWVQTLTFEHVSGEFFIARAKSEGDFGALFDDILPVEFRIGADGKVESVGVGWEKNMKEEKIWLKRMG